MPRKRGGGRAARAHRSATPRPAARSPPPKPGVNHAAPPAPAPAASSRSRGLLGVLAEGLAFGTGSAVAHRTVDAVMGPRKIQVETVPSAIASAQPVPASTSASDACGNPSKAFQDCINSNSYDISKCQIYLDLLNECRRNSGSAMGA